MQKILPKFSRLYSEKLPDRVILKGPSGENWNAKLRKDITGMYLQDGWRKFHIDNSLGNKEFLLFKYDGKRSFEVQIYDPTGLERVDIPVTKSKETNLHSEKRPRGRPRKCPVGTQNPPQSTYPTSQAKALGPFLWQTYIGAGQHNPEVEPNKLGKIKEEEEEMDLPVVRMSSQPRKHKQKNKQRRVKAGKPAAGFPVSKSIFKCHSVEKNASQSEYIPGAFAQVHIPWEMVNVVLRNQEGKTWEVVCMKNRDRHHFSAGWSAFVRDNKLGPGDVCVFELLPNKDFLVTIFRSPETSTARMKMQLSTVHTL
ncbi:B3 domain-containing protein Os01g0723500-like [Syzygium oleosum]|uniref:B3 domain-containing protein Os01g0723500-like n=1 Tax=Syzygium oleosum TaxID=219896 RepID=UPI0024B8DB67|nr:B3 domain-containing protein Os01g0723500-like [Syzygium oleosum]